jgi:hypothetical protein
MFLGVLFLANIFDSEVVDSEDEGNGWTWLSVLVGAMAGGDAGAELMMVVFAVCCLPGVVVVGRGCQSCWDKWGLSPPLVVCGRDDFLKVGGESHPWTRHGVELAAGGDGGRGWSRRGWVGLDSRVGRCCAGVTRFCGGRGGF